MVWNKPVLCTWGWFWMVWIEYISATGMSISRQTSIISRVVYCAVILRNSA